MLRRHRTSVMSRGSPPPAFEPLETRLLLAIDHPIISEFMAINNHVQADEDGDYADWIEICNPTSLPVDLTGWHLTDDDQDLTKWTFPAVTLNAGQYRIVFASNKDRRDPSKTLHTNFKLDGDGEYLALVDPEGNMVHEYAPTYPEQVEDVSYGLAVGSTVEETLVGESAPVRALVPTSSALGMTWTGGQPFDDSGWISGTSGVGYDRDTTYGSLIKTDLAAQMDNKNPTAYMRFSFNVADPWAYSSLKLYMKYDDGYIAYLNGAKIAQKNPPATTPAWNSAAGGSHDDNLAMIYEEVNVTTFLTELLAGTNVLAIHGLNVGPGSSDFLMVPKLVGGVVIMDETARYFAQPTPGYPNTGGSLGVVADTKFSVDRGFYDAPITVAITTATSGAEIRYTLDGSTPTATTGTVYAGPIAISKTTVLRAAAFKAAFMATDVDTQTYVFLADVIQQSPLGQAPGPGWPTGTVNGQILDYGMDPDVVNNPLYASTIKNDLKAIPTISLVTDLGNLFDLSTGIYVHAGNEGAAWERPVSMELINPDGTEGFQINAGFRIRGGYSRSGSNPKHAFRLFFREKYGSANLNYPLFGDEGADEFDNIDLRCSQNYSWSFDGSSLNTEVREVFSRDAQREMGQPYTRSCYYHLYINGVYWGLYQSQERSEADYAASYFGGDGDDYDVMKAEAGPYNTICTDGNDAAWYQLWQMAKAGFSTNAAYYRAMGLNPDGTRNPSYPILLDPDNLIDYMLVIYYGGNLDAPISNFLGNTRVNNFFAIYNRKNPDGFKYFAHDNEHTLLNVSENRTGPYTAGDQYQYFNPQWLHQQLMANADYAILFADHVYRHFFNGGVFTPTRAQALFMSRATQIDRAIVGESARWGDSKRHPPYARDTWLSAINSVVNSYLPQRASIVVSQFTGKAWYPNVTAPSFQINGQAKHGGLIAPGSSLSITAPAGTIYYTLDGTDPRLPGGARNPAAVAYGQPVALGQTTGVKARSLNNGVWSALCDAAFLVDEVPTVRITEMMYNPGQPSAAELAKGFGDNEDFEYIEVRNVGTGRVFLGGMRFTDGVDFLFPDVCLAPGQYGVIVGNRAAFELRYSVNSALILGEFAGNLNNNGEHVQLETPLGRVIHDFEYDGTWFDVADGQGFSLNILDDLGPLENWGRKDGWYASTDAGGTPGAADNGYLPGSVAINEVLAHSHSDEPDWIELHNTTAEDIPIGGWFLSDSADNLKKYTIPAGTVIHAGEYLVFWEDLHFGSAFALSELGDEVFLSSGANGNLGGYREHVDFGASPTGMTIGLHHKVAGGTDFTLMASPTRGGLNSGPFIGPLILNEIMYHPADPPAGSGYTDEDYEFVELYNRSAQTLDLTQFYIGEGIGFTFGWYDADSFGSAVWTLEAGLTATWTASLPQAGDYQVYVWWDGLDGRGDRRNLDSAAQYAVGNIGGPATVLVDQGDSHSQWISLGTFSFNAGAASVTLTRGSDSPGEWTIADRVKFVKGGTEIVVDNAGAGFSTTGCPATTLGPGEYLVLVSNLTAFDERYDIAGSGIPVAGEYSGRLENNGEKVVIYRADNPEPTGYIPYIRNDHVNYDDELPWPPQADGTNLSLSRVFPDEYGNDAASWNPSRVGGTPGRLNEYYDISPPTVPANVAATAVTSARIDLSWETSADPQSWVDHYVVYRNGTAIATPATPGYSDQGLTETATYTYEVTAVNRDGYESARSSPAVQATPRPSVRSAGGINPTHLRVYFGKPLDRTSAETPGNYAVTDPDLLALPVVSGTLESDGKSVTLTLEAPMLDSVTYTVTVNHVTDQAGNSVLDNSQVSFVFRAADPNLLAWWPLDQAGAIMADATGNGRDMTVVGATWRSDGRIGGALYFDGVNDYAVDPSAASYLNNLSAFTVSLWVKSDVLATDRGIFTTRDAGSTDCLSLRHDAAGWAGGASNTFKGYFSTTAGDRQLEGAANTQTTDWQYVAVTWTTGGRLNLYMNAVQQTLTQDQGTIGGLVNSVTKFIIGLGDRSGYYWKGMIDDVRIYNKALSLDELRLLANVDPVAVDDAYQTDLDQTLSMNAASGVLANDLDPDGPQALTTYQVDTTAHGYLTLRADGSFLYVPMPGFHGLDTFTYMAYDGMEYSRLATVTITVTVPASPPTVLALVTNDGADRPGELGSVTVAFSQDVSASLDVADLRVHNDDLNQDADLGAAELRFDAGTRIARWDLSQVTIQPGHHTLSLLAAGITGDGGLALDGDGDGAAGGDYVTTAYVAIPGDMDMNGGVDFFDFLGVKGNFGRTEALWTDGDFDYDGEVSFLDFLTVKANFGRAIAAEKVGALAAQPSDAAGSGSAMEAGGSMAPPAGSITEAADPVGGSPEVSVAALPALPALPAAPAAMLGTTGDGNEAPASLQPLALAAGIAVAAVPTADALVVCGGGSDALAAAATCELWGGDTTDARRSDAALDVLDILALAALSGPLSNC